MSEAVKIMASGTEKLENQEFSKIFLVVFCSASLFAQNTETTLKPKKGNVGIGMNVSGVLKDSSTSALEAK